MKNFFGTFFLLFAVVHAHGMQRRDTRWAASYEKCGCAIIMLFGGGLGLAYVRDQLGVPPELVQTGCVVMEPANPHLRACCWTALCSMFGGLVQFDDPDHSCCVSRWKNFSERHMISPVCVPKKQKME